MKKALSGFIEEHWLNVLESVSLAIIVVDPEGRVEFMNEAAAHLTGQSASLAIGQNAREVFAVHPWIAELVPAAQGTSEPGVHIDRTLTTRLGQRLPVHAGATPLWDEGGMTQGTLITLQDVSQQRELAARLREVARLEELETLVAGLAHEVRNPLSGMRGAAQLLSVNRCEGEKLQACSKIMVEEVDRLDGLMKQLLQLSGPPKAQQVPVNIHQLLDRVTTIELAAEKDARFERNFDPSLPPVAGDPDRLTQVLLNLVRNAVEASPNGSSVTLTTRMETDYRLIARSRSGSFLSVEVSDQGQGIAEGDLERIFAPFYTTKTEGTGLGLAISKRIVSEHGGALRAHSRKGHGSVFTVTLPVTLEPSHGS